MATSEIKILIRAVDEATQTLKKIAKSLDKSNQNLKQVTESIKKTEKEFSFFSEAAKVAAGVLIRDFVQGVSKGVTEAFELGAEIKTLKASFEALKKATGGTTISLAKLRKATKGTVADVDLLRQANQAMALGLPTDELDELFRAAMKLGRAMGIDTLRAVESLTTGIGRQSKLILDNLGIVFRAEDAYKWYAKAIGKTVSELTESEKRLAWQSYAIEQVKKKAQELGDVQDDAITRQEQWNAQIKNFLTRIGEVFAPLAQFKGLIEAILPLMSSIAMAVLPQMIREYGGLVPAIKAVIAALWKYVAALKAAIAALITKLSLMGPKGWAILAGAVIAAGVAIYKFSEMVNKSNESLERTKKSADKASDAMKKLEERLRKIEELERREYEIVVDVSRLEEAIEKLKDLKEQAKEGIEKIKEKFNELAASVNITEVNIRAFKKAFNKRDFDRMARIVEMLADRYGLSWEKAFDMLWNAVQESEKTLSKHMDWLDQYYFDHFVKSNDKFLQDLKTYVYYFNVYLKAGMQKSALKVVSNFAEKWGLTWEQAAEIFEEYVGRCRDNAEEQRRILQRHVDQVKSFFFDVYIKETDEFIDSVNEYAEEIKQVYETFGVNSEQTFTQVEALIANFADQWSISWEDAANILFDIVEKIKEIPKAFEEQLLERAQKNFEKFKNCVTGKALTLQTDVTGEMGKLANNITDLIKAGLVGEAQRQMQAYVECSSGKIWDMVRQIDGYMAELMEEHNAKIEEMKAYAETLTGAEREAVLKLIEQMTAEYKAKMEQLAKWKEELLGKLVETTQEKTEEIKQNLGRLRIRIGAEAFPFPEIPVGGIVAGKAGPAMISINAPLVNIEGSADRETAELAAKLVEQRLKTVLVETSSSAAPTKRIRILRGVM